MKNRSALQLLLVSLVIGLTACQISVPLYCRSGVYYLNLTYGTDSCQVLTTIQEYSYNLLNSTSIPDQCGSKYIASFIGQNSQIETYYTSSLSISGFEGVWNFIKTNLTSYYDPNVIALTSNSYNPNPQYHSNIIDTLYANGSIKSKRFFFNVKGFFSDPYFDGELYTLGSFQIGQPDLSLLENGSKLVTMKSHLLQTQDVHILVAKQEIISQGETLKTQVDSFRFTAYNNQWSMHEDLYNSFMPLWQKNNVCFYQIVYPSHVSKACFLSMRNLQPIDIFLTQEDGSDFVFRIEPEDYVYYDYQEKRYCFNFSSTYSKEIVVGQYMLKKYYYGYDTATQQTFLGKKSTTSSVNTEKVYNFRGSPQKMSRKMSQYLETEQYRPCDEE